MSCSEALPSPIHRHTHKHEIRRKRENSCAQISLLFSSSSFPFRFPSRFMFVCFLVLLSIFVCMSFHFRMEAMILLLFIRFSRFFPVHSLCTVLSPSSSNIYAFYFCRHFLWRLIHFAAVLFYIFQIIYFSFGMLFFLLPPFAFSKYC